VYLAIAIIVAGSSPPALRLVRVLSITLETLLI
jgi:hypothetical protein